MDRTVNGVTTRFYWDGFTPYMEASGSNMQYAYFGSNIRFDLGSNYAVDTSDSAHVLLRDEAGNIVAVTNKTGTLESHFEYDAWGNDLNSTFSNAQNVRQFRTGKFFDSATGLYYNQARWYDPTLGRFISESPIAPFAEEEYVYCGNDPVNFGDIDGYEKQSLYDSLKDSIEDFGKDLFDENLGPILDNIIPQNRPNTPPGLFPGGAVCTTVDDGLSELSNVVANQVMLALDSKFPFLGFLAGAVQVNNPWGRRGSPEHKARIADIERRFKEKGWDTVAGGSKKEMKFDNRYPDLVLTKGEKTIAFQVGRTTLGGRPVWRERRALTALRKSGNFAKVWFLRY